MTLQVLLERYGIMRPADLAHVLGIDRRLAWSILHGKSRITPKIALALHDRLGIPLEELLRACIQPTPAPRGRPRKRPPEPPPEGQPE
jgi:transcriptional regulator with XRE-family HTH domain